MLITAAKARDFIPGLVGTGEDAYLNRLCQRVSTLFARFSGYPGTSPTMEVATYTSYLDGRGGRDLVLPVWPIVSVTSIYEDSAWDFAADSLVASSDYAIFQADAGIVRLTSTATHGTWADGIPGAIKATYTAGYAEIPADLEGLAGEAVRHFWDRRGNQGIASTSGGSSIQYEDPTFLPDWLKEGLALFCLPSVVR